MNIAVTAKKTTLSEDLRGQIAAVATAASDADRKRCVRPSSSATHRKRCGRCRQAKAKSWSLVSGCGRHRRRRSTITTNCAARFGISAISTIGSKAAATAATLARAHRSCGSLWFGEYVDRALQGAEKAKLRKIYALIDQLSRLLQANPNGICKWPPYPVVEGQW
jgi:hypothetical protein